MADFFLEEAVLDDLAEGLDLLEMPLSKKTFKLIGVFVAVIIAVVVVRLFFLSVWAGKFYQNRALLNAAEIISLPAERGIIYDRFGEPLVKNEPVYRLSLRLTELFKPKERLKIFEALGDILKIQKSDIEGLISSVDLEKQNSVILSPQLTENEATKFKELNLKAVQVEKNFKREYFESKDFSHLLGFVGPVSKEDLRGNSSFSINDIVGKSGLENFYDEQLRGEDGRIIYYRNARGETLENKFLSAPKSGEKLETTIDGEFQSYFYNRLREGLNNVGSQSGAGIAMNPKTGEILSLVSLPSFDSNKISQDVLSDRNKPLFNRTISGLYSPGSTIKPLVALAALKEGVINPKTQIFSRGYIEIPNPYFPDKPSRFVDWKPHGWVDLRSAIARSSNIYFYALGGGLPENESGILTGDLKGGGLGIEKLKEYWQKFGLGEKTGIDLSYEAAGILPDSEGKKGWRLGDTYNVSIGQGDLIITPIELLNYIAAIANNGKFYRPFVKKREPQIIKDYSDLSEYIKEVQRGMVDAVEKPYGTAHLLADLSLKIAAKTGTAQTEGNAKINAFFVGYAPTEEPQIAILVLIENAKEGSLNAVPVAKDVLRWYSENRITQKL
ncbi:MAG: Penicillin-binding protein 2 [Candidatus Curtissbacteria bacterium GW2011_GWA1_40_24]|uniref:Penicillin-binding protein 2 n=2 Tax=Patescibacteria group TaxID=1783273 RepID=A0A0G0S0G8_9BACT|nr:MAG: Penicillin-binding protein 2 [Candidatus Curtissbacteria bacterium GW2011_GWA1_40_24]KKR89066.1 MAG: Penicillin-binding protein 2 [Candidatus Wolfebacteria bacterium GW2011_GWB1_41_12]